MTISLRRMTTEDIEFGMRLKEQAGWNQTTADWQRFLKLEPEGCFIAEWEGRPVATTTTCIFRSVGWIAMVLVDESFRHRGIATRLVQHALQYLQQRPVITARLDATRFGRPVYERMGFIAEYELVRFQGVAYPDSQPAGVIPAQAEHLDSLAELDRRATGTVRRRLIEQFVMERPQDVRLAARGESVVGYIMLRPGSDATQIGPAVATSEQEGRALCDWAFNRCAGQPVLIDVPLRNRPAIDWVLSRGLTEQRQFSRMYRGQSVDEHLALLWASSGPENG